MRDDELGIERALTREFREALEAFAEDARALVQDEVERGRTDPEEWALLARRVAREEIEASSRRSAVSWPTALAGAAVAVLLVVAGWGGSYAFREGEAVAGQPAVDGAVVPRPEDPAGLAIDSGGGPGDQGSQHPAWLRYEALLAGRDSSLRPLVEAAATLDSSGAASLRNWWSGTGPPTDSVRTALTLLALRRMGDTTSLASGSLDADLLGRLLVLRALEPS